MESHADHKDASHSARNEGRRLLRAAQVPEYRLKLIGNAAKLAETFCSAIAQPPEPEF